MTDPAETARSAPSSGHYAPSRVVVGVDGTEANWSAVLWAAREARRSRCPLVLVGAGPGDTSEGTPRAADLGRNQAQDPIRDMLDDVRDRIASQVDDIHDHVAVGEPSQALIRASDESDLLVVGKRRSHRSSQSVPGSTSVALAGRSAGPIVIVPEGWSVDEHPADRLVVGVEADRDSQVLDFGFARASDLGVKLGVVCSWDVPAIDAKSDKDVRRLEDYASDQLDRRLQSWRRRYPAVSVRTESRPLAPGVSLLGAATDAQLLVVGQNTEPHHPGDPDSRSTTLLVLHHASCPVAVVPSPQSTLPQQTEGRLR